MVQFCHERGYTMSAFPMILRDESGVLPLSLVKESLWFNIRKLNDWHRKYYHNEYDKVGQGEKFEFRVQEVEFECNAHQRDLVINVTGNGVLCGKVGLGTLQERPLEKMWNSAEADEFRLKVDKDREPCMTCDYRQRCLSPSMIQFENHFSEKIVSAVSAETRQAIAPNRTISDEEALDRFIRELADDFGIYDIQQSGGEFTARRVHRLGVFGETLQARNRHALQQAITAGVMSKYHPTQIDLYEGHNIVRYLGRFWALPQVFGVMNLQRDDDQHRPGVLVADSLADLKAAIDKMGPTYEIIPVKEYKAHNIVKYMELIDTWGLPLMIGQLSLVDKKERERPEVIVANSLPEVLAAIDKLGRKYEMVLVQEHKAHNIVQYLGRCWGLPLALGQVNLADEKDRQRADVVVADTLPKMRAAIDRLGPKYEMLLVEERYKAHNIVQYFGRYWGLPLTLGEVNLANPAERRRPGLLVADTLVGNPFHDRCGRPRRLAGRPPKRIDGQQSPAHWRGAGSRVRKWRHRCVA